MKKLIIMACAVLFGTSAMGQTFKKGDKMVNVGIGVGTVQHEDATFTQKVSIEWGVASIGKSGTLGVGVAINNAYGDVKHDNVYGTYDYKYNISTTSYINKNNRWQTIYDSHDGHRQGYGTADAKLAREDVKLLVNASYHHSITNKLEAYVTVGVGAGLINGLIGSFENYNGFESKSKNGKIDTSKKTFQYASSFSYNDLDHADFDGYTFHKVGFACSAYAGARYSVTDKLSAFGEVGLESGVFKKNYNKGLDIFTAGVSYKF